MTSAQTPLGVESTLPDHTQLAEDQFGNRPRGDRRRKYNVSVWVKQLQG